MTQKILSVLTCLVMPIMWGAVVNWIFDRLRKMRRSTRPKRTIPDYQI